MGKLLFLLIILFSALYLGAEDLPPAQPAPAVEQDTATGQQNDVFIDKDGDGIADNRDFKERKHQWRYSRSLSQKMCNQSRNQYGGNGGPGSGGSGGGNGPGPGGNKYGHGSGLGNG